MEINDTRWNRAQKLEYQDWSKKKDIVKNELEEIYVKYESYLKQVAKKIGINKKWKILDLGCGPTCITRLLPDCIKYGIDPLAKKLGIAGQTIGGVKVIEGKGEKIPYGNKHFELVVCRNVIDHAQNPHKIINEVLRVLKPNGYFMLSCYVYTPFIVNLKIVSEKFGFLRNMEHPHSFTSDSLIDLCRDNFIIQEKTVIFEGKHSTDFGKIGPIEPDKSKLNQFIVFINRVIMRNNWFVREYFILMKKRN